MFTNLEKEAMQKMTMQEFEALLYKMIYIEDSYDPQMPVYDFLKSYVLDESFHIDKKGSDVIELFFKELGEINNENKPFQSMAYKQTSETKNK